MTMETRQADDAARAIEHAEGASHLFEPLPALARRFGMSQAGVLEAFNGRVLFVKWMAGKPWLRTVDVERLFEC